MFQRWTDPEAVFQILKELSRGQPCDITGIEDYRMLDERGGIQWPYPSGGRAGGHRAPAVRGRGVLSPGRKARFLFEPTRPMPEPPDRRVPAALAHGPRHGRAVAHADAHQQVGRPAQALPVRRSMSRSTPRTRGAAASGPTRCVFVESQRGEDQGQGVRDLRGPAGPGLPPHALRGRQPTDAGPSFDPYSRQPSYKDCAVRVRPLGPWKSLHP